MNAICEQRKCFVIRWDVGYEIGCDFLWFMVDMERMRSDTQEKTSKTCGMYIFNFNVICHQHIHIMCGQWIRHRDWRFPWSSSVFLLNNAPQNGKSRHFNRTPDIMQTHPYLNHPTYPIKILYVVYSVCCVWCVGALMFIYGENVSISLPVEKWAIQTKGRWSSKLYTSQLVEI